MTIIHAKIPNRRHREDNAHSALPDRKKVQACYCFFVYFGLRSAVWKCNLRHVSCQPHAGFAKSWVQKLIWIQDLNNTLKHVEIQCQLAPDFQQLKLLPREVAYRHLPDVERLHSRKAWPNVQIAHLMLLFDVLQKSELLTDFKVKLSWTARVYKKPHWT